MNNRYCPECHLRTEYKRQNLEIEREMGKSYYCASCDQLYSDRTALTRQELIESRIRLFTDNSQDQEMKGGES